MVDKEKMKEKEKSTKSNLQLTQDALNKKWGAGSVQRGRGSISNVRAWSTGIASLDIAIGCGGLPEGRIIEVYGPESSGKTTTTLHFVAACQALGENVAFIDVEHALDPEWATKIGVDVDKLIFAQPNSGEEAIDIALSLVESGEVKLIIVDSVAALTTQAELDGDIGDAHIGAVARLMSQSMKKISAACSNTGTTIVFINQIREKIGVMFGSPETTTGGRALKFYASVRIEIRRAGEQIKEKGDKNTAIGYPTKAKIVKNKVGPPFVVGLYNIMFGISGYSAGIDKMESLVTAALNCGVFQQSSSWYCFNDQKFNGIDNLKSYLRAHPELVPDIREKTYEVILSKRSKPMLELTDEELAGEDPVKDESDAERDRDDN